MNVRLSVAFLLLVGCGGRGASPPAAAAPPPEVVKALQVPENPYRIIYTPPVSLAKPPDTTAHARKPGGGAQSGGGKARKSPFDKTGLWALGGRRGETLDPRGASLGPAPPPRV